MQFLITARDGETMLENRMRVRPSHLANMEKVRETGAVVCAGGILDADGRPVGSVLILDFPDRAHLDAYLESEPYIVEKVWADVSVQPMHAVIVKNEIIGD